MQICDLKQYILELESKYGSDQVLAVDIYTPEDMIEICKEMYDTEITNEEANHMIYYLNKNYDSDYGLNNSSIEFAFNMIIRKEYIWKLKN